MKQAREQIDLLFPFILGSDHLLVGLSEPCATRFVQKGLGIQPLIDKVALFVREPRWLLKNSLFVSNSHRRFH